MNVFPVNLHFDVRLSPEMANWDEVMLRDFLTDSMSKLVRKQVAELFAARGVSEGSKRPE